MTAPNESVTVLSAYSRHTVESLWRCPKNGALYTQSDGCNLRCWATPGQQEKHQPVQRLISVQVLTGHHIEPHR